MNDESVDLSVHNVDIVEQNGALIDLTASMNDTSAAL